MKLKYILFLISIASSYSINAMQPGARKKLSFREALYQNGTIITSMVTLGSLSAYACYNPQSIKETGKWAFQSFNALPSLVKITSTGLATGLLVKLLSKAPQTTPPIKATIHAEPVLLSSSQIELDDETTLEDDSAEEMVENNNKEITDLECQQIEKEKYLRKLINIWTDFLSLILYLQDPPYNF